MIRFIPVGILALIWSSAAYTQATPPGGPPGISPTDMAILRQPIQPIQKIGGDLYFVAGGGGNSVVLVTPKTIVLVDCKNSGNEIYGALVAQIRSVSSLPIKYVINTHNHGDHAGNNARFMAAGAIVEAQAVALTPSPGQPGQEVPALPTRTFTQSDTLHVDGAEVRLIHFTAHTGNDAIVYFPREKVIAAGDIYTTVPALASYAQGGSLYGMRDAVHAMLKLDFVSVVPGHGPVMKRADLEKFSHDLDTFIGRLEASIASGTPKDALMASIKSDDISINPRGFAWSSAIQVDGVYQDVLKHHQ
ncbi:MAG: MBL fold metallo-hydrolase [Janthinobacterium lividum]